MRAADIADLLKAVAKDVRELIAKATSSFEERIAAIDKVLRELPVPPTAEEIITGGHIARALADGVTPRIDSIVERLVAVEERAPVAGAPGERGEPGERGAPGEPGERGAPGEPGKDVDEDALQLRVDAAVSKAVAAAMALITLPKDGADGKDGEDGRDALQIDILDAIVPEKSYPRGTFARWRGGVIRSFRTTDELVEDEPIEKAGWSCLIDGINELTPEATDDPRNFQLRASTTSGKVRVFKFSMPTPIWRGVWTEREFGQGDMVTHDGSIWHCERPTKAKPGTQTGTPDWKLCTKKGRDGKDGEKGQKGDRGDDGRPGRDLTQLGFDGSKT